MHGAVSMKCVGCGFVSRLRIGGSISLFASVRRLEARAKHDVTNMIILKIRFWFCNFVKV